MSSSTYVESIITKKLKASSIELVDGSGNIINLSGDIDTTNLQNKLNFNGAIIEDSGDGNVGPSPNHIIPSKPNADDVVLCGNIDGTTEWRAAKLNLDTDQTLILNEQTNVIGVNFQNVQEKLTSGRQITVNEGVIGLDEGFNAVSTPAQVGQVLMSGNDGDLTWTTLTTDGTTLYGLSEGPGIKISNNVTGDLNQTIIKADYNAVQPKLTTGEGLKITGNNLAIKPGYHLVSDPLRSTINGEVPNGDLVLKYKNTSGLGWQPDTLYDSSINTASGITGVNFTKVQQKLEDSNVFKINDTVELTPGYTIPHKPATAGQYLKSGTDGEVLWSSLVSPSVAQKLGAINTGPGITLTKTTTGDIVDTNFTIDYTHVQPKLTTNEYFNIGASSITLNDNYVLPPKPLVSQIGQNAVLKSNAAGVMSWQAESSTLRSNSVFAINEGAVEFTPAYMPIETVTAPNLFLKSTGEGEADWVNIVSEGVINELNTVAAVNGIVSNNTPSGSGTNLTFTVDYTKVQAKLQNSAEFVVNGGTISVGSGHVLPTAPTAANMVLKSVANNGSIITQWDAETANANLTASGGLEVVNNVVKPTSTNLIPPKPTSANNILKSVTIGGNTTAQWEAIDTTEYQPKITNGGANGIAMDGNTIALANGYNLVPPAAGQVGKVLKSTSNGVEWGTDNVGASSSINVTTPLVKTVVGDVVNLKIDESSYIPPVPALTDIHKVIKCTQNGNGVSYGWSSHEIESLDPRLIAANNTIDIADGYTIPPRPNTSNLVLTSTSANEAAWTAFTSITALDNLGTLTAVAPLSVTEKKNPAGNLTGYEFNLTTTELQDKLTNGQNDKLIIDTAKKIVPAPTYDLVPVTGGSANAGKTLKVTNTGTMTWDYPVDSNHFIPTKPTIPQQVLTTIDGTNPVWSTFATTAAIANLGTLSGTAPIVVDRTVNTSGQPNGYNFRLSAEMQPKLTNTDGDKIIINSNKVEIASGYDIIPATSTALAGKVLKVSTNGTAQWLDESGTGQTAQLAATELQSLLTGTDITATVANDKVSLALDSTKWAPLKPAVSDAGKVLMCNSTTDYGWKTIPALQAGTGLNISSNTINVASSHLLPIKPTAQEAGLILKATDGGASWAAADAAKDDVVIINAGLTADLPLEFKAGVTGGKASIKVNSANIIPPAPSAADNGKFLVCAVDNSANVNVKWDSPVVSNVSADFKLSSGIISVADNKFIPSKTTTEQNTSSNTYFMTSTAGEVGWSVPVSGSELANMGTITGVAPIDVTDALDGNGSRSLTFRIDQNSFMPYVDPPVTTEPLPLHISSNGNLSYKNADKIKAEDITVKAVGGNSKRVRIEQSANNGYNLPTYSGNQNDVLKLTSDGNAEWVAVDEPTTASYVLPHIIKSFTNKYGELVENGTTVFKYDEDYKKITYNVVNNKIETGTAIQPFISVIGSYGVNNEILGKEPIYTDNTGKTTVLKNLAHDLDYIYPTVNEHDTKIYSAYPKLETVVNVIVYKYIGYFKSTLTAQVSNASVVAIPDNAILCTSNGAAYTTNNRVPFDVNFERLTIATEKDDSDIRRYVYTNTRYKYPLSYVLGIDIDPSIVDGSNDTHLPKYTLDNHQTGLLQAKYNDRYPYVAAQLTTSNMGPLTERSNNILIKYNNTTIKKYALTNENGAVESFSYIFNPYDLVLPKYSINGNSLSYVGNAAFPDLSNTSAPLCYTYTSTPIQSTAVNYTSGTYNISSITGRTTVPEIIELKFKRYIGYYKYSGQNGIYVLKANKAALALIDNIQTGAAVTPPAGIPPANAGNNGIAINEENSVSSNNIIKCDQTGALLDPVPDKYYVKIGLICVNGAVPVDPAYATPLLFAIEITYNEITYGTPSEIALNSKNKIGDIIMRLPTNTATLPADYQLTDNNEMPIVPFDGKVHALKYSGYFKTAENAIYHTDVPKSSVYKAIINNSIELTFKEPQSISAPKTYSQIANMEAKNLIVNATFESDNYIFDIFGLGTFTFQITNAPFTLTTYTVGENTNAFVGNSIICNLVNTSLIIKGLFVFDIILTDFNTSKSSYNVTFYRYITNNRIHVSYNTLDCFIDYESNSIESAQCIFNDNSSEQTQLFMYTNNAINIANVLRGLGDQTTSLTIQFTAPNIDLSASNSIMFNVNNNGLGIILMNGTTQPYMFRPSAIRTDNTKTGYTLDGNDGIYMDIIKSANPLTIINCNLYGFVATINDYNPAFNNGKMYIDFNLDIVNEEYYLYNINRIANTTAFNKYGAVFNNIYPAIDAPGLGNTVLTRGDYIEVKIDERPIFIDVIINYSITDIENSITSKNFNITIQGVTKTFIVSNTPTELNIFTNENGNLSVEFKDNEYYVGNRLLPFDSSYSLINGGTDDYYYFGSNGYKMVIFDMVINDVYFIKNTNGNVIVKNVVNPGMDMLFTSIVNQASMLIFPHNIDVEHVDTSNQINFIIIPSEELNENMLPQTYSVQKNNDDPLILYINQEYNNYSSEGGNIIIDNNILYIGGGLVEYLCNISDPTININIKKFINTYFIISSGFYIIYNNDDNNAYLILNRNSLLLFNLEVNSVVADNIKTVTMAITGQTLTVNINTKMKQINATYLNIGKTLSVDGKGLSININGSVINYEKTTDISPYSPLPGFSYYRNQALNSLIIVSDSSNYAIISGLFRFHVYVTDFNTNNCKAVFDFYEKQDNYYLSSFYTECIIANPINVSGIVTENYPILNAYSTIFNSNIPDYGNITDLTSKFRAEVKKSTGKMLNSATYCDKAGRPITDYNYKLLELNYKMGRAETYNPYYENTLSHSLGLRDTPAIPVPPSDQAKIYPKYFTNNLLQDPATYPLLASSTDEYLTLKLSKVTITDNEPIIIELSGTGTLEVYECKNNYTTMICAPVIGPVLPVENIDDVPVSAVFCDVSGRALKPNELTMVPKSITLSDASSMTSHVFKHALGFGDSYTTIEALTVISAGVNAGGEVVNTVPGTIYTEPHFIVTGSTIKHVITGTMLAPNFGSINSGGVTLNYMQYKGPYYKVIEINNSIIPYNFTNPPVARELYPNPLYELSNAIYRYSISEDIDKSNFSMSILPMIIELYITDSVYTVPEIKKAVSMYFNKATETWLKIKPLSEFTDNDLIYGFTAFEQTTIVTYFFNSSNELLGAPVQINSSEYYNDVLYEGAGTAHYKVVAVNKLDSSLFYKRLPSRPGFTDKTNDMVLAANKFTGSNNEIMAYDGAVDINVYGDNNKGIFIRHIDIKGNDNKCNSVYYSSVDGRNNVASNSVKLTIKGDYNQVDNDYNEFTMTNMTNILRSGISDNLLIDLKRLLPIEWFGVGQAESWQRHVFINDTFKILRTNDVFYQFMVHAKSIVSVSIKYTTILLLLIGIEHLGLKFPDLLIYTNNNLLNVQDSLTLLCENKVCLVHFIIDFATGDDFIARNSNNTQSDDQALLTNLQNLLNDIVFKDAYSDLPITKSLVEYYLHKQFNYYFTNTQLAKFTDLVYNFLKSINETSLADAIGGIVIINSSTPKLEQAYKINLIYTILKEYTELYITNYNAFAANETLLMKITSIYGNHNITRNTNAQILGDENNVIESKTAIVSGSCNIINASDNCSINGVKNKIYQSNNNQILGRFNNMYDSVYTNLLGNYSNVTGCDLAAIYGNNNNVSRCGPINVVGGYNNINKAISCNVNGDDNTVENITKCSIVGNHNRVDLCEHLAIFGENNTVKSLNDVCIIGREIDLGAATLLNENSPTNIFGHGTNPGRMLIGATNIGNTLNLGAGLIKKTTTINETTTMPNFGNNRPYIKIDYNTSQLFITNGAINVMKNAAAGHNIVNVLFPAMVEGFEFTLIFHQPVYLRIFAEYAFTLINSGFMPDTHSAASPFNSSLQQLETDTYVKKVTFTCLKDGFSNYWFCS